MEINQVKIKWCRSWGGACGEVRSWNNPQYGTISKHPKLSGFWARVDRSHSVIAFSTFNEAKEHLVSQWVTRRLKGETR